jgi:hypothetical protein
MSDIEGKVAQGSDERLGRGASFKHRFKTLFGELMFVHRLAQILEKFLITHRNAEWPCLNLRKSA